MISKIILAILAMAGGLVLFIVVTEGRYFGKTMMRGIYNQLGPGLFSKQSEVVKWQTLAQTLRLRGDERILDVGTAIGDLPLSIAAMPDFGGQITGIDWSSRMIAAAQTTAKQRGLSDRVKFQVADVRIGLPFENSEFDVVICLGVIEGLPQPEQILKELKRVLTPTGMMVLSLYKGWAATNTALDIKWYEQHFDELGLKELRIAPCRQSQDVVIARSSWS